jgi:hypothetical protein
MKNPVVSIILATIWISISEFVRNEFLLKNHWTNHYESMGLVFPSEPVNGAIWGLWSLFFAIAIYIISRRFNLLHTFVLSWFIGFILMWVVTGNMGVLPFSILPFAVPLSLFEAWLATFIIVKLSPAST